MFNDQFRAFSLGQSNHWHHEGNQFVLDAIFCLNFNGYLVSVWCLSSLWKIHPEIRRLLGILLFSIREKFSPENSHLLHKHLHVTCPEQYGQVSRWKMKYLKGKTYLAFVSGIKYLLHIPTKWYWVVLSHGNQAEIYSNTLSCILKPWTKVETGSLFEVDHILKCPRYLLSIGPCVHSCNKEAFGVYTPQSNRWPLNGIYIPSNKIRLVKDNATCCHVNGIDGRIKCLWNQGSRSIKS